MYEELKHLARSNCHLGGKGNFLKLLIDRKQAGLNLSFKGKPPVHMRRHLRFYGFRWSRKNKYWGAYLNDTQLARVYKVYRYINKNVIKNE